MARRRDEGFVLARFPYRERDVVVAVLSRESGVVRLMARRARGVRSALGSALESLAYVNLTYFERARSELATLDEVVLKRSSFPLARDPTAWAAAQVLVELALEFCPPGQRAEALFRLFDRCLQALLDGRAPQLVVDYASLWFLRLTGILPELDRCGACGTVLPAGERLFDEGGETFVCRDHLTVRGRFALSAAAHGWLSAALREPVERIENGAPGDARAWLERLRLNFTDRELKSLRVLQRLQADEDGHGGSSG